MRSPTYQQPQFFHTLSLYLYSNKLFLLEYHFYLFDVHIFIYILLFIFFKERSILLLELKDLFPSVLLTFVRFREKACALITVSSGAHT